MTERRGIRVRLNDGRAITVNTDDPQAALRTAERWQRDNPAPQGYREAYQRRERERNPRQGGPTNALGGFNRSMDWTEQMVRNMGVGDELSAGSTWLGQSTENLIRRARGQPIGIPAGVAAQAAADWENNERDRFARERPLSNAVSIAASVPAFAGNPASLASYPLAIARAPTVMKGGLAAAGINAPFAFARQEGDLQQRLPGAAQESALALALGAGAQGLASRSSGAPRLPNGPLLALGEFEARPTAPAWSLPANLFGAPRNLERSPPRRPPWVTRWRSEE